MNAEVLEERSLPLRIEVGRGRITPADLLRLEEGSVVELEKAAGDPVELYLSGRRLGRGEVLVLEGKLCVRMTEVFSALECLRVGRIR